MPDRVRIPWWQQSWLLGALVVAGLVLVVLNIRGRDWLGLAATVLVLIAILGLWGSFRRQRRDQPAGPRSH